MQATMHEDIESVLYSEDDIARRVKEMGQAITADYASKAEEGITVISVLCGGAVFMTDLVRAINLPIAMDFMAVSSYGNAAQSSGVVRIIKDLTHEIAGRHVIIAEDIIDSGLTLNYLLDILAARNPASIAVAALLKKQVPNQAEVDCKYLGFECPNEFVVGYGLDFAEKYRNLPYVGILKPEVYKK